MNRREMRDTLALRNIHRKHTKIKLHLTMYDVKLIFIEFLSKPGVDH